MTQNKYDVVAVGNAIVDVLAMVSDDYITRHALNKGSMALIDAAKADELYDDMGQTTIQSGGSAANTIAGIASFGGACAYIGKVADDEFGRIFKHDLQGIGVDYDTVFDTGDVPTARCLVAVTNDAERTMSTFLGVSTDLSEDDLDANKIKQATVTYLEGYLFDKPTAKAAFQRAAQIAHDAGGKVALTLSDKFCVERHRDEFRDLVANHIDILFANEDEIKSLYQVETLDEVIESVKDECAIAAITCGKDGSVIVKDGARYNVKAEWVDEVVDTTGAGDLYAAGFLYGYTQGHDMPTCGRLGGIAAAEIISHIGARPEQPLAKLLAA